MDQFNLFNSTTVQSEFLRRDHSKNLGVDGKAIVKYIFKNTMCGVGCIHVAQDKVEWQVAAIMKIKLRVQQKMGNFLAS
jgi:hypothetical protein